MSTTASDKETKKDRKGFFDLPYGGMISVISDRISDATGILPEVRDRVIHDTLGAIVVYRYDKKAPFSLGDKVSTLHLVLDSDIADDRVWQFGQGVSHVVCGVHFHPGNETWWIELMAFQGKKGVNGLMPRFKADAFVLAKTE